MTALLNHLPDVDHTSVLTYRAVISDIEEGHFSSPLFTLTKRDTLENIAREIQERIADLDDGDDSLYGLVIEEVEDQVIGNVHRIRFSRDEAVATAA